MSDVLFFIFIGAVGALIGYTFTLALGLPGMFLAVVVSFSLGLFLSYYRTRSKYNGHP